MGTAVAHKEKKKTNTWASNYQWMYRGEKMECFFRDEKTNSFFCPEETRE